MELWSGGVMGLAKLHYSITPPLHHSQVKLIGLLAGIGATARRRFGREARFGHLGSAF